jgi:hypothetical protein
MGKRMKDIFDYIFSVVKRATGTVGVRLALLALLPILLAACNISGLHVPTRHPDGSSSLPAASPTTAALPGSTAVRARSPIATKAAGASSTPAAGSPPVAVVNAIKAVVEKGNQEEIQAFATHDPSAMQDTSTADYYQQIAQSYQDMSSSGVTALKLDNLVWGPVTLQDANTAQANTTETWTTTYSDGSTLDETDPNVYTVVLQNGAWLVQDDQHPNTRTLRPQPGTPGAAPTSAVPTPIAPLAPGGTGIEQSSNWAGYAATGGNFTVISATWTIPNVSAGSGNSVSSDATWVGIGGVNTDDLIQAGTQAIVQNGRVQYSAWWETLPQSSQPVAMDVSAGDSMNVSITQQADGTWQVFIHDTTSGQTFQKNLSYQSSLSSAEWIEESPSAGGRTLIPLDNFGSVTFTNASTLEDGKQHTIQEAGGQPITMYSSPGGRRGRFGGGGGQGGQPLAQPSALGSDGATFSVTRTNAPAPSTVP